MQILPIHNTNATQVVIEREHRLRMLQQLGAGTRRLVELPEPQLPRDDQRWRECLRLLDNATQSYRRGEYEQALAACRQIAEGIPHVLCDAWGLPKPQNGQPSFEKWLKAIEGRLTDAWPQDTLTPGMLYTLLTGAWKWLAPAPTMGLASRCGKRSPLRWVSAPICCTSRGRYSRHIPSLLSPHREIFTSAAAREHAARPL